MTTVTPGTRRAEPGILRYSAFSSDPAGGNPAGVVLDATGLDDAAMLRIAAAIGYSETAFAVPRDIDGEYDVRYFSPLVEVPFCGHATVATAVALGRTGTLRFHTAAGPVEIDTDGVTATLTSVPTSSEPAPDEDVAAALAALRWDAADLDPRYPAHWAFGGARHLVVAVRDRARLAALDYDFDALGDLLRARGAVTAHLVHQRDEDTFDARDPFPVGGVVEDAATGAAAAAFGGYLRELGLVTAPRVLTVHQGVDMGRPSTLTVRVSPDDPRVAVTGAAVAIPTVETPAVETPAAGTAGREV
ncbi:PhzF family phenazine biosynthesis isomerase [Saccharothrix longispora]|uniref:PhzF family phenazine biosynthesis protein n=1 Tax=Saccharothrix longispora TaxID=33920 RepID=UPI0028FD024F|nr:PhzF family phenazine biosynthesis isomerase [Saccharothrix longispora]MBY8847792.1 PhzF family phenazine biosynthesis protein [Saccharothrix sp. MB29]MDU0291902.1 PhzF family phenazine biosynthesis isomerase [Saccharothrix longispora]